MKKIFLSLVIAMFAVVNVNAQIFKSKNYVKPEPNVTSTIDKTQLEQNMLYMAGKYQAKSASLHFAAIGFTAGACLSVGLVATNEDMGDDGKKVGYIVAGAMGMGAIISELCAISFQFRSGKNLKIAASKITYTF